jgi:flavin reductase (DIM6/NTAB) family NADH-FMN oxidoreductase RutF
MQKMVAVGKAISRKFPESVVLVTTCSDDGRFNAMAVGWVTVASSDPLMFALGIADEAYTLELIRATREFVVAFPPEGMARGTLYVGSRHGRGRDKLSAAGIAVQPAEKVCAPLVADAVANFECKLVRITKPGDCPIVFGRVVAAHENHDARVRRLYTLAAGHRLGGVRPVRRRARPRARPGQ